MIKKEQLLEHLGFKFDGDGFICVGCPKGLKFTLAELKAIDDNLFVAALQQHEKHHPIDFNDGVVFQFSSDPSPAAENTQKVEVKKQVGRPKKTEPLKEGEIKSNVKDPQTEKKANPPSPSKKQAQTPAKVAPALPIQLKDLQGALLAPKRAFISAGGTEEQFAKEINFAAQHLMKNDYLIGCAKKNPEYLIEAVKNIALTGLTLNPELKLGYLVPRGGKIYFNSSYMGKREIVNRTGHVKDSYAALVYEKDKFEVHKGTNPRIEHIPHPWGDRGALMGGYWVCMLSNGSVSFDTMTKERIDEIKNRSEAVKAKKSSPWDTDYDEMALKTVYNWGYKFMPKTGLSPDQIKALEIESKYDNEVFEEWAKSQDKKADQFDDDGPAEDDHIQEAKIVD